MPIMNSMEQNNSTQKPQIVLEPVRRRRGKVFPFGSSSKYAVFSLFLGLLSVISAVTSLVLTYRNGGSAKLQYGTAFLLAVFMAVFGIISGILSRRDDEEDIAVFWTALVLNGIVIIGGMLILYLGTEFLV